MTPSLWVTDVPHNNNGTFTSAIGDIPGYFFFQGNGQLWVYGEQSFAKNTVSLPKATEQELTAMPAFHYAQ